MQANLLWTIAQRQRHQDRIDCGAKRQYHESLPPPHKDNEILRQGADRLDTQAHAGKGKANNTTAAFDKPHGQQGRMGDLPCQPHSQADQDAKQHREMPQFLHHPARGETNGHAQQATHHHEARAATVDEHAAHRRQEGLDHTANREGGRSATPAPVKLLYHGVEKDGKGEPDAKHHSAGDKRLQHDEPGIQRHALA